MRVLVSGAAGMLGHALQGSCPEGLEVIPVDRSEMDLTDAASVTKCLQGTKPEVVVNCSAFTQVDACEDHEQEALAVNGTGAGVLATACAEAAVPLAHVSTDYVFDGTIPEPGCYVEGDATNPLSAYGRTKLAGEQAVAAAGESHWIVRTQWLYGLNGPNFVETMLRLATEHDVLRVVNDQVGSPTSTHALAALLWRLVSERPAYGIYHAANRGACSWYEFAVEIFRQAGVEVQVDPIPTSDFPRPATRPARGVLSTEKLSAALNVEISTWQEALGKYLELRKSMQGVTP
ncbi:MAG: dTDP-4-dehydrorhamnose reductase [Planctomycetota bacterium]|nr:dTDP-4-dehydrorhamnose reductase [Planctomycetota bacterium]